MRAKLTRELPSPIVQACFAQDLGSKRRKAAVKEGRKINQLIKLDM
jgi:hypothetical protein